MSRQQAEENFFNIDDPDAGIARQLAEGVTARIFPGEQAMVSVVRLAPGSSLAHSHPGAVGLSAVGHRDPHTGRRRN